MRELLVRGLSAAPGPRVLPRFLALGAQLGQGLSAFLGDRLPDLPLQVADLSRVGLRGDGLPFVERRARGREAREDDGEAVGDSAAVAASLGHRLQLLDDQALFVVPCRDIARIVDRHDAAIAPEQGTEPLPDRGGRPLDLEDERTGSALETHPLAGEAFPEGQIREDIVQPHPYSRVVGGRIGDHYSVK
ncbi:hypothetical protein [Streptomyces sp. NPDC088135]|uniref:hypothetical protein n=1 Tax=Streptomyces sp. NPDC088135 TaxID=3160993 RepID=UPI00344794C5